MLIDSHCHLDYPELSQDLENILARAQGKGVARFITISTRVSRYDVYRALAEAHESVWFTVGTHPHYAGEEEVSVEDLITLTQHPRCIGIGETGLDYHYDHCPHPRAHQVFRTHIEAAQETQLPLIIHSREAEEDMTEILTNAMKERAFPALLHCFTGSAPLAYRALELGCYISFSGVLTFKNSSALRDLAREIPLERLLVETDAPYLAPIPYRGKPNEPSYMVETAKVLADLKGIDLPQLARLTTQNLLRLFSKMPILSEKEIVRGGG